MIIITTHFHLILLHRPANHAHSLTIPVSIGIICLTSTEARWPIRDRHKGDKGLGVPGEIKRSRDRRGGRWCWTLKLAQKKS